MTVQQRKERERAERHRLILTTARGLAEAEGWDAVTTRRLAERIEYGQPVLYSHFRGREEIVGAVALEGFTELTAALKADPRPSVAGVAAAYVGFAERHPAVYDAMFSLAGGLPFADEAALAPLHEAFTALLDAFGPAAGDTDPALFTEVAWAALHGLVTLTRAGRIPPEHTARRVDLLVDRLVGASS